MNSKLDAWVPMNKTSVCKAKPGVRILSICFDMPFKQAMVTGGVQNCGEPLAENFGWFSSSSVRLQLCEVTQRYNTRGVVDTSRCVV